MNNAFNISNALKVLERRQIVYSIYSQILNLFITHLKFIDNN